MSSESSDQAPPRRVCLVRVEGQPFAFDVTAVREVVDFADWSLVPRAPATVIGVANLRGTIVPILDAGPLLGLPPQPRRRPIRTLLVQDGSLRGAIAIEDALALESHGEVLPFGEAARQEYGTVGVGLIRRADQLVPLLDARRVLDALRAGVRREELAASAKVDAAAAPLLA